MPELSSIADTRVTRELAQHIVVNLPDSWRGDSSEKEEEEIFQDWRAGKDRSKTSHVLLLLCLNVGVDPPDILRVEPCAKLECWTDPVVAQSKMLTKGSVVIGDLLAAQYKQLQKSATFKACLELSEDDLKYNLFSVRKKAKEGRVLLHYNGHGVPKVTQFGELWFFDTEHRQYVPVTITDIMQCVGSPTIYVLDCNNAGAVLQYWYTHNFHQRNPRDVLICACRRQEDLPLNPGLPADLLTSCLTTPIKMSLEWYYSYSLRECLLPNVTKEMLNNIPGSAADRKTPLGELHWIFTAITDAIAWCTLDRELFNRLFRPRNDMLQVSLFRNFLLAERIMRDAGCVPVTHPPLPPSHTHPMWEIWELSLESVLSQLPKLLNADMTVNPEYTYKPSSFFADQLTAFEVCVDFGSKGHATPDQLPCIIQGLSSHQHRLRSLKLLAKYLDLGAWAVVDSLSCGVMPYVVRLLHQPDLINYMVLIWTKLLLVDCTDATVTDLIKVQMPPAKKFLKVINVRLDECGDADDSVEGGGSAASFPLLEGVSVDMCQSMAFVVMSMLMVACGKEGQVPCWNWGILSGCLSCLLPISEVNKLLAPSSRSPSYGPDGGPVDAQSSGITSPAVAASSSPISPPASSGGGLGGASSATGTNGTTTAPETRAEQTEEASPLCKSWALMCLAQLVANIPRAIEYCVVTRELHSTVLMSMLSESSQNVRACACFCLSKFVGLGSDSLLPGTATNSQVPGGGESTEKAFLLCDVEILRILATVAQDPSPHVREEVFYALLAYFMRYNVAPDAEALQSQNTQGGFLQRPDTMSTLNTNTPTTNYSSIQQGQNAHSSLFPMLHSTSMGTAPQVNTQHTSEQTESSLPDLRTALLMDACKVLEPLKNDPFPKLAETVKTGLQKACAALRVTTPTGTPAPPKNLPKSKLFDVMCQRWKKPVFHADAEVAGLERKRHRDLGNRDVLQGYLMKVGERQFVASPSGPPEKVTKEGVTLTALATGDAVVSSEFRCFTNQVVLADASNVLSVHEVTSQRLLNQEQHPHKVSGTFLVNDATDSPSLLVTDKRGVVSMYSQLIPPKGQKGNTGMRLDSSFTACADPTRVCADWDNAEGSLIYSGDSSKVLMYNMSEERLVQTLAMPKNTELSQLSCDATGSRMIASGFDDGTVRLWDARQGGGHRLYAVLSPSAASDPVVNVSLRLGTYQLFSAHKSGAVRVWDLRGRLNDSRRLDAYKHKTCSFAALHHTYPIMLCGNGGASGPGSACFVSTKNTLLGEIPLPKMANHVVSLHKYQSVALLDKYVIQF